MNALLRLRQRLEPLIAVPDDRYPDAGLYLRARIVRALALLNLIAMAVALPVQLLANRGPSAEVVGTLFFLVLSALLYFVPTRGQRALVLTGVLFLPAVVFLMVRSIRAGGGVTSEFVFTFISLTMVTGLVAGGRAALAAGILGSAGLALGIATLPGWPAAQVLDPKRQVSLLITESNTIVFTGVLIWVWDRIQKKLLREKTEAACAEQEARTRLSAMSELDHLKTAFLANVSHEFRTPLTLTLGLLEEALGDPASIATPQHLLRLREIRRHDRRLERLVNSLLEFSRIESGRAHAEFAALDLSALTREIAEDFRSAMEREGLDYQVDCPALPRPVYADSDMWERIVSTLLANAHKYTQTGRVTVTLGEAGDKVDLRVSDTGCGIALDQQPNLFQRFRRLNPSWARTANGVGIGLSLIQELVRLHLGTIQVDSAPGKGSTFIVRIPFGKFDARDSLPDDRDDTGGTSAPWAPLPRSSGPGLLLEALSRTNSNAPRLHAKAEEGETESQRSLPGSRERGRVLVVEDDADMRKYLLRVLGKQWDVEAVVDGQAALLRVWDPPLPDLILSDVLMPRMDGLEMLRALRDDERTRALPVILLTARGGGDSAVVEGLRSGANDYLVKPFSRWELEARVAVHMERQRILREKEEFVHLVTHDLRGPLTSVMGYQQMAQARLARAQSPEVDFLVKMGQSLRRMERLIGDLSDDAALEAGKLTLRKDPCELLDLCRIAAEEEGAGGDRQVELDLSTERLVVLGDEDRLMQVIRNLLGNAFKYGKEVRLSLRGEQEAAVIEVSDKGPGISREDLPFLFEKMYRTPDNKLTAGSRGGLGLGLYLCREIVRRHGGTIEARSTPGQGTSFLVRLARH